MIFSQPLLTPASTLTRARMPGGEDRIAVGQVLRGEPFHAGHRDDASGDAVRLQQVAGIKRDLHFGAGADQQDAGSAAVCISEDVRAAGGPVGGSVASVIASVKDWYVLPAQDDAGGTVGVLDDGAPADAGLVRVAGPDHVEPGDIPKRGELLDRLMGRPVLAQPDRIVGQT